MSVSAVTDKSRNLRQVESICPWFEHCTNPPPTWSFRTKPRIHSLTPIKDKENMPLPYFLYLSCESYGKNSINKIKKRCLIQRFNEKPTYRQESYSSFWMQTKEGGVLYPQHRTPECNSLALAMCCPLTGHNLCRRDPHHHWLHPGRLHHAGIRWFFLRGWEPQHCRPAWISS